MLRSAVAVFNGVAVGVIHPQEQTLAFNVCNRPELGSPTVNLSSPTFGQILSVSYTSPIGTGSARSIQLCPFYVLMCGL
jgi:hypothetical protein